MDRTELLKIAKPILFNTEMVQAILDGRKTVTRRVVKTKAVNLYRSVGGLSGYFKDKPLGDQENLIKPTYCKGDVLYVRETWAYQFGLYWHKATRYEENMTPPNKWKPSIHMPKSAARIFLKVTDVRVERLQDITEEQAIKEGFNSENEFMRDFFKIYPKQHLDWLFNDEDLWVWVYEFERVECDERK